MIPPEIRALEHMQYHGLSGGGPDPDCDLCRQDERQAFLAAHDRLSDD